MTRLALEMIKQEHKNRSERGALLLLLMLSVVYFAGSFPASNIPEDPARHDDIFLQVEGSVNDEGTYSFPSEVFMDDLIERAGGLSVKKELPAIYENIPLQNGVKVNIEWEGTKWRISLGEISAFNKLTLGIPISINKESKEGLTALPGIGPRLAEGIVHERAKKGGFNGISELKNINGIGERLYKRIADSITL